VSAVSVAIDVNPPHAHPILTREDVWRGLLMKAENALPFVLSMQSCTVLERTPTGLLREVVVRDDRFVERVTFTPQVQVLFERVEADGTVVGWISNVISDSDHGLLLTFSFNVAARGDTLRQSYVRAVNSTLAAVRKMALEGSPL